MKRAMVSMMVAAIVVATGAVGAETAVHVSAPTGAPESYKSWTGIWESVKGDPPYWGFPQPDRPPGAPPLANYGAACRPMGMPGMMMMLYLMETIATPTQLTIISEDQPVLRRIYLDGRPHPTDGWPTYTGHSIGHWEGETLVVDTVGIRIDTAFNGRAHTDALHVVERIRLVDANTLEDRIVTDDAKATDNSWSTVKRYTRIPKGQEVNEFVCEENNLNPPDAEGQPTFKAP